jgi:hypothetical protein
MATGSGSSASSASRGSTEDLPPPPANAPEEDIPF